MHRFLRIEYWGIYAIRWQPAKGHPKWWQDKQQIAATALAIKQYFSPYAEGGGWQGKRSEGGHAYLLKLINCLKMTETTANGKTQNVIFRNFCCISVLSQSFFLFFIFFLPFCLLVCLCFWFCLSVREKAQRDVAHFALMSDYTSHVSCELWADLDSQLWRSSPSPSCPSNWSKCLVVVVVGCEMSLASFLAKKCIEFASVGSENAKLLQVAPVLTQTTWKKNVKLKNQNENEA